MLTKVDGYALDLMATLAADIEALTKAVREAGYMNPAGTAKHPALATLNAFQARLVDLLKQYGLTARGRTGLGTGLNEDGNDPLIKLLRARDEAAAAKLRQSSGDEV